MAFLGEYDVEDSMRATACLIHVGGSHSPAETDNMFPSVCESVCFTTTVLVWFLVVENGQCFINILKSESGESVHSLKSMNFSL